MQSGIYDYVDGNSATAYQLNISGVGGFETRLASFGVFLELDISVPTFGLIGSSFRVFPTQPVTPHLTPSAQEEKLTSVTIGVWTRPQLRRPN